MVMEVVVVEDGDGGGVGRKWGGWLKRGWKVVRE